jgi:hypothetical protein
MRASVDLGGLDVFHLMNDRDMRARGLVGNHCVYVVELAGKLDPARLQRRLDNAVRMMGELRFRLGVRFPFHATWRVDERARAPIVGVRPLGARSAFAPSSDRGAALSAVEDQLAQRVDGASPWAVDLLQGPERDVLAFRWFHALADAKAAERLVTWLGSGDGDVPEPPPPEDERFETSERPIRALDRARRMELMHAYNVHVMELGRVPILSFAGASRGRCARGSPQRIVRVELSVDETRAFDARVRARAKLAETSVMVWLAARIVDSELGRRGFAPPRYLIPVPLSLDPKVGCRRMFGSHLSMMMFALDRDDLGSEPRAIASLAEQQRTIVRNKLDLGMAAALDFARWLPRPAYRAISTRPFGGMELGSLIFSNPGAVSIASFAGVPVVDALPVPAVLQPPGFEMIASRFAGRLSLVLGYMEGVVSPESALRMAEQLRREASEGIGS